MSYFILALWSILAYVPWIAAWLAGTVIAAILFRRESGRAQRVALWGFSLMLAVSVIRAALSPLGSWLVNRGTSMASAGAISAAVSGCLALIGLAAVVCIVYAFWNLGRARSAAQ